MARLEVEISGEIKQLERALDKAKKELQGLDKQSIKTGRRVASSGATAARGMTKLGGATANAVPAVTEFSRVIQDAPFGIQGVANNITQLTQQFGTLSAKTGGAKAALKAMLSTLSGPAGILFAVSTVTSLLVVFGDKLFKTKKNLEDAGKASEDFVSGIKSLDRSLSDLFLTQDDINSKIEDYIILQKLKANADSKEQKSIERVKKINEDLEEQRKKLASAERLLITNKASLAKEQDKETTRAKGFVKAIERETQARNEALKQITKLEKDKKDVILESLKILKEYREQRNKLNASLDGSVAALENQKKLLENEQRQVSTTSKTWQEYAKRIQEVQDKIDKIKGLGTRELPTPTQPADTGLQSTGVQTGLAVGIGGLDLQPVLQRPITQFDEFTELMKLKAMEFNNAMKNIIQNNIVNTFAGIGQAIGNALSGAQNLGDGLAKVLLGSIGSILKQLGQLAIAIGVTMAKVKAALKTLNPAVAIAAGTAAIALGTVFSNASGKLGGSIGGGGVAGGGSFGGSSFGGSRGFTGGNQITGNVTFRIQGTDLVGVLNNQLDQNGIFGGNIIVSG